MANKTSQKYSFTLSDISELLDLKLGVLSDKFDGKLSALEEKLTKKIDQSATGIIAEMDRRFDDNDDVHQEILGAINKMTDNKIENHVREKHSFVAA